MDRKQTVHVAVGVLRNEKQQVLVALRPLDVHQGGLWEFPGGKVEQGESVDQALGRELEEELGVRVLGCTPLTQIRHDYGDKSVLLDVWTVDGFAGNPSGQEGQDIEWRDLSALREADFPKANERIIRALHLPDSIAITPEARDRNEMEAVIRHLMALAPGLIYFRQKSLDVVTYMDWFGWARKQCAAKGVRLMYCHPADSVAACALPELEALHVTSRQLASLESRPTSRNQLFSVSCHNLEELRRAEALDADFAFLSPVCKTDKYQDSKLLGWAGFQQMARQVNLPLFALGGMRPEDLPIARLHQGFGIAGISAFVPS